MKLHILQQVPFEGPGMIVSWAEANECEWATCEAWHQPLPSPDSRDAIVLMGGSMSVHDTSLHPWLVSEKAWLREQLRNGCKTVGICLGAQLVAETLGARVFPNRVKEIGWMPVTWTDEAREWLPELPGQTQVLHWHGDTFDLPGGATRFASTAVCRNQAFLRENALGLQFHLEAGKTECARMIENCGEELHSTHATVQSADALLASARECEQEGKRWLHHILHRFILAGS